MTKKELMIKAHKMAKEIKKEYPTVDYKFQLGLCLTYLYEEGENEMIKYTTKNGTKVEIALNEGKVTNLIVNGIEIVKDSDLESDVYVTTLNNTIVLNGARAYRKLGARSVIRIEASAEVIEAKKNSVKKIKSFSKEALESSSLTSEQFKYSYNKHMNDKNNF